MGRQLQGRRSFYIGLCEPVSTWLQRHEAIRGAKYRMWLCIGRIKLNCFAEGIDGPHKIGEVIALLQLFTPFVVAARFCTVGTAS